MSIHLILWKITCQPFKNKRKIRKYFDFSELLEGIDSRWKLQATLIHLRYPLHPYSFGRSRKVVLLFRLGICKLGMFWTGNCTVWQMYRNLTFSPQIWILASTLHVTTSLCANRLVRSTLVVFAWTRVLLMRSRFVPLTAPHTTTSASLNRICVFWS